MRVWLVTIGEPLPGDGHNERLHRVGWLAEALVARGHEVTWWSSTFDHIKKRQRADSDVTLHVRDGYQIRLLHANAYRKNVSLQRLANHRALARKFRRQAPAELRPAVIHASWPTIELSLAATDYGVAERVPVVVDVRDLWPDIFAELAPPWARGAARAALAPLYRATRTTFRQATAVAGVTPAFVDWGLRQAGRARSAADRAFSMGYSAQVPGPAELARAEAFWDGLGVRRGEGRLAACFIGTMGYQKLELEGVLEAARRLSGGETLFQFVLCGNGEGLPRYRAIAGDLPNVVFPGWIDKAQIWSLMRRATIGLAPYPNTPNFMGNLPNKPVEYLSAGLPILSSVRGTLERLLRDHGCGITYEGPDGLVRALIDLARQPDRLAAMSAAAASLYRDHFVAETVYDEMAGHLEDLARSGARPGRTRRNVAPVA